MLKRVTFVVFFIWNHLQRNRQIHMNIKIFQIREWVYLNRVTQKRYEIGHDTCVTFSWLSHGV